MSSGRRLSFRRGFTLVEALVAVVLAGVGVAATLNGIAALTQAQARATEKERMVRLALSMYDELVATGDVTNIGGVFDDPGASRFVWEASTEPAGVENLTILTVTVRLNEDQQREASEEVVGLVYEEPSATEVSL